MTKKYFTVVFEYDDGAELLEKLTSAFKSDSMAYEDAKITAISMDDEISKVERLEIELEAASDY